MFDVATGSVAATHAPCGPRELLLSLALGDGPGGPTAYLGIWRSALRGAGAEVPAGRRLRALDLATGAVVGEVPLAGVPTQLVVARAPGAAGLRVYCVEGSHSADPAGDDAPDVLADQWLLRGFDPLTLAPESTFALAARPRALAVAADGDHAYALADAGGPRATSELVRIDLRSGAVRPVHRVPGTGDGGLVVAGDRLYVPDPEGDTVTAVDRHRGGLLHPAATGRAPPASSSPAGRAGRRHRGGAVVAAHSAGGPAGVGAAPIDLPRRGLRLPRRSAPGQRRPAKRPRGRGAGHVSEAMASRSPPRTVRPRCGGGAGRWRSSPG